MRAFAAVPPTVWQTDIKKLRGEPEAVAVYFHLLTSPHTNMIGMYPLDLQYVAIDLGSPLEGASKGLRRVCEAGLATYDEVNEIVWVHDMAISQVAPRLSPKDNRVQAVAKLLATLPICPITLSFYTRYRDVFHLRDALVLEDFERASRSPFEAPSEPLRSKEKEKEQDKDPGQGKEKLGSEGEELGATRVSDEREDPYEPRSSIEDGRRFLIGIGVPVSRMETALQRLMRGALFPCDVDEWKHEAVAMRGAA
ncbi:hypothetical protein [Mesorhizobium sp. Pch-S]|uniref:hypothetical protein n=1 Tax=Mesorhizobium sp. Pch-S TaxID=2082387 RepID=UPI0010133670|nr:hypothetical protein [Mesorhizobium sp. Pch-S]QAZ46127.1 hypothetical protein C1M53_27575 [Mesorhizobium sp. Pch-S]